ncbi:MAG: DUF1858 domain-containing protein [Treponemataceae bacterium]|nr:DUF1858 domain-containing protein [Treponemataceae bacterium]
MLIGDVISEYPEVIETFFEVGMHCLTCPASQLESIQEAAYVHGLDPEMVVEAVNDKLAEIAENNSEVNTTESQHN